jgi:hypothetical protein
MTLDQLGTLFDALTKLVGALASLCTLFIVIWKAIPTLEQIHQQTNSLALKAEAGARALGVQEGLQQAAELDPHVASAARAVLAVAAEQARVVLASAADTAHRTD